MDSMLNMAILQLAVRGCISMLSARISERESSPWLESDTLAVELGSSRRRQRQH